MCIYILIKIKPLRIKAEVGRGTYLTCESHIYMCMCVSIFVYLCVCECYDLCVCMCVCICVCPLCCVAMINESFYCQNT